MAGDEPVLSPLAGTITKVPVQVGQHINEGDILCYLEAMKMETEVRAAHAGTVAQILVKQGDAVKVGDVLMLVG